MQQAVTWQSITYRDPFLAGSLAAREYWEWDETETPEGLADSVGLTGERRADFLRGWQEEIAERDKEQEPKAVMLREYDAMSQGYEKGDPAR